MKLLPLNKKILLKKVLIVTTEHSSQRAVPGWNPDDFNIVVRLIDCCKARLIFSEPYRGRVPHTSDDKINRLQLHDSMFHEVVTCSKSGFASNTSLQIYD